MKISEDKKFAIVDRCCRKTGEQWQEILNLEKITSIQERRMGKGYNTPGKRIGYLAFTEDGNNAGFLITDEEFEQLLKNEIFGVF